MKRAFSIAAAISLALTAMSSAADQKFRADGSIQRISSDMILVRTSAQDVEIIRDASTKVTGQLRRGGAVTVMYTKKNGQNVAAEIIMGSGTKPSKSL